MEKYVIKTVITLAVLMGCMWVFNHVNAWIGILLTIATLTIIIKQLTKKQNEKN